MSYDEAAPWTRVNSLMKVFSALPTLPLEEFMAYFLFMRCLSHATETNHQPILASGAIVALLNKLASNRMLGRTDTIFYSPATIMLSPRLPLYTISSMACALYVSYIASLKAKGASWTGQVALAGLLTHLFTAPQEFNGPRFLWWTWHDSHPAVVHRLANAPASALNYALSMGTAHALVSLWWLSGNAKDQILTKALETRLPWLPEHNRPVFTAIATMLDSIRTSSFQISPMFRIFLASLFCIPLHSLFSLAFQLGSLDKVGKPTLKSYRLQLAVLAYLASKLSVAGPASITKEGAVHARLAASVVAYYGLQTAIAVVGDANHHVSTGFHQSFGRSSLIKTDTFGNRYEMNISGDGPVYASANDFSVEGVARAKKDELRDAKICALEDVQKFRIFAEKRKAATIAALNEAKAWAQNAQERIPTLKTDEFVREVEASNTVRLARLKTHLESRLDKDETERLRIVQVENRLEAEIAKLDTDLMQSSIDPAGNKVIPPHEFGVASVWYTVRGISDSPQRMEELIATLCSCCLGVVFFTKALTLA
jgi:hypothetical protein